MPQADLHFHSHFSDGTESPRQLLERAKICELDMAALTDHDTVEGVGEALEAGRALGIEVIPGVEITAHFQRQELHLLAYFPPDAEPAESWRHPDFLRQLALDAQRRAQRAEKMVARLNELGLSLTMDEVRAQAAQKDGTLGRPHVAAALHARGHVPNIDQAFRDYLVRGRPGWVDKDRAEASEIIALVHRCGGIVSLAHPGLLKEQRIPQELADAGLDAIEVYHTRHNTALSGRFRRWAQQHDLLITAGSDCHGMLKGEPLMGRVVLQGGDLSRLTERLGVSLASKV